MRIPRGEKINVALEGEVITLDINKEFSFEEGLDPLPKQYAYLVSLKNRAFSLLKKRELEKDKHFYQLFMQLKEDDLEDRPRSDKWVTAEIMEDEEYLELLEIYTQTLRSFRYLSDILKSIQVKVDVGRTLVSANKAEKFYS